MGFKEKRVRDDIPPPDVWLINPKRDLIPTPLDERGIVDLPELISDIKKTVDSNYDWPSPFNDKHHLQWPRRWYPDIEYKRDCPNPYEFRHLGIGVVRVPRYFHNWTHLITEPPPPPSEEVMTYRIEAQRVAVSLFRSVTDIKREGRDLNLSGVALNDYVLSKLEHRFEDYVKRVEIAKKQPKEFHVVEYDRIPLTGPEDVLTLTDRLAKGALYRSAVRIVREPLAV